MDISIERGDIARQKCDLLVVNEFFGVKEPGGVTGAVNEALGGKLFKFMREDRFKAKRGASYLFRANSVIPAKRVLLVGLGKKEDFDLEAVRQAAAVSINSAKQLQARSVVSILHGAGAGELKAADCARAMVEGARLANYSFQTYKQKPRKSRLQKFEIISKNGRDVRNAKKGLELGEIMARATCFARDLVNTPARDMHPESLVEAARKIAKDVGSIRVRVYDREALERMGARSLLGVAQGSDHPPYMVHMIYKPAKPSQKKLVLVGKAVTFDSGGLSLKPSKHMSTMKCDMAGSAAVLGAFSSIADLAPECEVHGIFGAVENMPSGKALHPGDVLRAMNKKTIEVLDTDAEGRLTLADTLSYAVKQKPTAIIDLATLTGACVVALGEEITGIMSNDDELAKKVLKASKTAGEKMWRLPLEKNYKQLLKSDVADLKNLGNRWGGALTAGLFLEEFVNKTPWVHLDIAGPAFAERPIDPYTGKGATGHAVRTLLSFVKSF